MTQEQEQLIIDLLEADIEKHSGRVTKVLNPTIQAWSEQRVDDARETLEEFRGRCKVTLKMERNKMSKQWHGGKGSKSRMRYRNIEFRRSGIPDSNGYKTDSSHDPEIVAWIEKPDGVARKVCYTVCWFREGKEGWSIETVGSRFTEYEELDALMHVAKHALQILNTEKSFEDGKE